MKHAEFSCGDQLLFVLSAKSVVRWSGFKEIVDYLYSVRGRGELSEGVSATYFRYQALRTVNALGHCDFDFSGTNDKIFIAPTTFSRLPLAGPPEAVLAGARSQGIIDRLRDVAGQFDTVYIDVDEQNDEVGFAPLRITALADTIEELRAVCTQSGATLTETPASWQLVHLSGTLTEYLETLRWESAPELGWPRRDFNLDTLRFQSADEKPPMKRLSSYTDPVRGTRVHFLWDNGRRAKVDRDWGRYAFLALTAADILFYDRRRYIMAVPIGAPLPRLPTRALVLCSGYAPEVASCDTLGVHQREPRGYNLFPAVPPQVAEAVAGIVRQRVQPHAFDVETLRGPR